jgi:hypothetical protein
MNGVFHRQHNSIPDTNLSYCENIFDQIVEWIEQICNYF